MQEDLSKLYEEYGKLMVNLKIISARVNELEKKIAESMNKQPIMKKEEDK